MNLKYLGDIAGAIRLGKGALGKSAILAGLFLVAINIALLRVSTDAWIFAVLVLGAGSFFLWFLIVLSFTKKHPEVAVLDGAEWIALRKFEATAKNRNTRVLADRHPVLKLGHETDQPKELSS